MQALIIRQNGQLKPHNRLHQHRHLCQGHQSCILELRWVRVLDWATDSPLERVKARLLHESDISKEYQDNPGPQNSIYRNSSLHNPYKHNSRPYRLRNSLLFPYQHIHRRLPHRHKSSMNRLHKGCPDKNWSCNLFYSHHIQEEEWSWVMVMGWGWVKD